VIAPDELAAVMAALQALAPAEAGSKTQPASRWKRAAREPELELEELRAL